MDAGGLPLFYPSASSGVKFVHSLIDYRESPARSAEAGIHDVVEDRPEAVAQAEVHEVGIRCRELSQTQQPIRIAQISARQVQLISQQRKLPEEEHREALEQSQVEAVEEH